MVRTLGTPCDNESSWLCPLFLFFIIGSDGFHALRFQSWISFQTKAPVFYIINKLLYINFSSDELFSDNSTDKWTANTQQISAIPINFQMSDFQLQSEEGIETREEVSGVRRWRRVEDCGREIRPASQARWVD
jgi:hypothetical protein